MGQETSKHKAGVLTTWPQHLVAHLLFYIRMLFCIHECARMSLFIDRPTLKKVIYSVHWWHVELILLIIKPHGRKMSGF